MNEERSMDPIIRIRNTIRSARFAIERVLVVAEVKLTDVAIWRQRRHIDARNRPVNEEAVAERRPNAANRAEAT